MVIRVITTFGSGRPSEQSEICLYRIAQESLCNAAKHAGADTVTVSLLREHSEYILSIADKGHGFSLSEMRSRGLGILSMQERVEALQGKLTIWSKANQGTVVSALIPVDREPTLTAKAVPTDRFADTLADDGRRSPIRASGESELARVSTSQSASH